jgi:hypothetical protein
MCITLLNKNSDLDTSCVTKYMLSYFEWNLHEELGTSCEAI